MATLVTDNPVTAASGEAGLVAFITTQVVPWAKKSFLAILDQGLISGSNFLTSILLARWLAPDQYGSYAVAFAIFILLSLIYLALLLEPMSVFGGSSYSRGLWEYTRVLLWLQLGITLLIVAILGAVTLAVWRFVPTGGLAGALAGVTLAAPCLFLFWLARRAYYLELSPARAVRGAAFYCGLVLIGLFVLYEKSRLSPFTAFLLFACAALLTSCFLFYELRRLLPSDGTKLSTRHIWSRHWTYGRWALATSVASWIPVYIYYPLLSSLHGMSYSGQLRAVMNFTSPIEQTQIALAMLFLPYAARVQGGKPGGKSTWRLAG
ncbi:MAG TPA: hypothetical protein VKT29_03230, partial [Terriglobales bacterium]|nr:hypothetical protein [Terriglobales bacterium]